LMMNPVPWLQMTNMISYQGLVRTFLRALADNPSALTIYTTFTPRENSLYPKVHQAKKMII
ncbi:hypothetical protein QP346_24675, partial [Escherichia coli]|nr:hypothetical protein [Escherichia coli]